MESIRQSAACTEPACLAHQSRPLASWLLVLVCALSSSGGCASWPQLWGVKKATPPGGAGGPVDAVVLRGSELESEVIPAAGTVAADLEAARRLYHEGKYGEAEGIFAGIAGNTKNAPSLAEEATYYQAECLRLQGRYPRAAELYNKQLTVFAMGKHAGLARERLFGIANYWLDETRAYMEACREKKEGKRSWVWPVSFIHFDKTKPTFDLEGHAVRMLEQVYITDPTGPLAEKALWFLGSVKLFREDYREADHYFYELVTKHPNGPKAAQALQFSIFCKQMATGGSEYDGRLVAEARELVDVAWRSYPELANQQNKFLMDQLYSITQQQADKDWKIAEFYRRVGKPAPAYFMYELVRRRYPGTTYEQKAIDRMRELQPRADRDRARSGEMPLGVNGAPVEAPLPRPYTPGAPLETGPAPQLLPPSMTGNGRP
ncbi:MAG: outer membrane protein assembly factor BamD [Gemmataceae bacterium]|nr:outer membrane protein assembly factor BamD [Gemmataceae bacterium]